MYIQGTHKVKERVIIMRDIIDAVNEGRVR